jgi:hypothetical protein
MAKLFLFAAGGPDAAAVLDVSLQQGFSPLLASTLGVKESIVAGVLPSGRLLAWSTGATARGKATWSQLQPGDVGLGYAQGTFRYVVRLAARGYSLELAEQLWGQQPRTRSRPLLSFFDQVEMLGLPREDVTMALAYDRRFVPRSSLLVPRPEHQLGAAAARLLDADEPAAAVAELLREPRDRRNLTDGPEAPIRHALSPLPGVERHTGGAFSLPPAKSIDAEQRTRPEPSRRQLAPLPVAYAHLDAPTAAVVGTVIEIEIGLRDHPRAGSGDKPVAPPLDATRYELTIELVAPDFDVLDGASRRTLVVTEEDPFPTSRVGLRARPPNEGQVGLVRAALMQLLYSIDGTTVGVTAHAIAIAADEAAAAAGAEPPPVAPGLPLRLPGQADPPDITVRIVKGERDSTLIWSTETAWSDLQGTDGGVQVEIGSAPDRFASGLVAGIEAHKDRSDLGLYLKGVGKTVRNVVPAEFWPLLKEVSRRIGARPPQILVLTADPYVPWELATLPEPIDETVPGWLAAQTVVGRWPLLAGGGLAPPTHAPIEVRSSTVVSGVYIPPLEWAEEEATRLIQAYGSDAVSATLPELVALLERGGDSELLHFAVHGRYQPGTTEDGLYLADDTVLGPDVVMGAELRRQPLVFLNACQVGSGEQVLGDYAGLAAAFLRADASSAVAPLWSVDDELAMRVATGFYAAAFEGEPPAEYLRRKRASADGTPDARTYLAYQFFGHPRHTISR